MGFPRINKVQLEATGCNKWLWVCAGSESPEGGAGKGGPGCAECQRQRRDCELSVRGNSGSGPRCYSPDHSSQRKPDVPRSQELARKPRCLMPHVPGFWGIWLTPPITQIPTLMDTLSLQMFNHYVEHLKLIQCYIYVIHISIFWKRVEVLFWSQEPVLLPPPPRYHYIFSSCIYWETVIIIVQCN